MPEREDDDRPAGRSRNRDRGRDDRPRRRGRDDEDDYDDRPRRRAKPKPAGVLLVMGLVFGGLVLLAVVVLLMLFAVQRVRESAARTSEQNNIKQILIATHGYHDANGTLPPAQEPVSWRVYELPYIEQQLVYRQMDVTQPWDSPLNRRAANTLIRTYQSKADPPDTTDTRYRVFVGPHTLYEPGQPPLGIPGVRDGLSNTVFVVEAGEPVPWAAPRELAYDRNGPLPPLGAPGRKVILVGMLDGSVQVVPDKTPPDVFRGGIEPNDGRPFNP
jgi:hypothetical protein